MFEFKKIVTQPKYYLNYITACLITALTGTAIRKTTKKTNNRRGRHKIFLGLSILAPHETIAPHYGMITMIGGIGYLTTKLGAIKRPNFLANVLKRREKETQLLTTHKTFIKTHTVQQTKHQLRHDINRK